MASLPGLTRHVVAVALLSLLLAGSTFDRGPEPVRPFAPRETKTLPGVVYQDEGWCDEAPQRDAIWCEDFERNGESCPQAKQISWWPTSRAGMDCASTSDPIDGSYSFHMDLANANFSSWQDNGFRGSAIGVGGASSCRYVFTLRADQFSTGTARVDFVGMWDDIGAHGAQCRFSYVPDNLNPIVSIGGDIDTDAADVTTDTYTLVADTVYYGQLTYTIGSKQCDLVLSRNEDLSSPDTNISVTTTATLLTFGAAYQMNLRAVSDTPCLPDFIGCGWSVVGAEMTYDNLAVFCD